jgi:hypothetical protein
MTRIEVLRTGCPKWQAMLRNVERAVSDLALAARVVEVTDITEMGETCGWLRCSYEVRSFTRVAQESCAG